MMPAATTIVVAREDFSIPGGEDREAGRKLDPGALEHRFFNLLREAKPDVVVLDLSRANGSGAGIILKIRRQSSVPILVVYAPGVECEKDYRRAGAAGCIAGPVDIVTLNEVLQQIVRVSSPTTPQPAREAEVLSFAGVSFKPHQNLVCGPGGATVRLTSAECRLLAHFAANPWEIQTRAVLAQALYGKHPPATDRAIDVVVNRLRTKLRSIGESTQHLIKTEFRRGYRFVSDAVAGN
jgi:two-component system OmpR family response regulator